MRAPGAVASLAALLALGACGEDPGPEADLPADSVAATAGASAPDTVPHPESDGSIAPPDSEPVANAIAEWTAAVVALPARDAGQPAVASVTAARHPAFDRVVWELSGIPGVRVEYVDEPVRACGSGNLVPLPGDGWLEVRLEPARAHTEAGRPTIPWRRTDPSLPVVLAVARTCDFEGIVTHVLAVRSPEPFRVLRLDDPPRVVVDIRHPPP